MLMWHFIICMVRRKKTQPLAQASPLMTLQIGGCIFLLSPRRPKGGAQVLTLSTDALACHLHCLVLFSAPTPQAVFSMKEEGKKSPENNPILIRFS